MLSEEARGPRNPNYGARPVSVDIARGRVLAPATASGPSEPVPVQPRPLRHAMVADRLALAHWTPGHRIVVCAIAGGTGRTTLAGLVSSVLEEQSRMHRGLRGERATGRSPADSERGRPSPASLDTGSGPRRSSGRRS